MFFIAELEHVGQLIVYVFLEHVFVFVVVKSITENAEQLVHPQFHDVLLAFVEPAVRQINALENLGYVSHIEYVMRFGGRRQKLFLN